MRRAFSLGRAMATEDDYWWEPPLAGTEAEQLIGALDRLRVTFRWKADGLDDEALRVTVGRSSLTMGGLLKHLAACEDHLSTVKLTGEPPPVDRPSRDWAFVTDGQSAAELYALWDGAVERSRARIGKAIADGGLDQLVAMAHPDGTRASLRRLLCDFIEEYGRHTGHADLLREAIDGVVGEDPPPGWRPRS